MNILLTYVQVFKKASAYSLYVLIVLLIAYMLNQLDRYALSITSIETAQSLKYGVKNQKFLELMLKIELKNRLLIKNNIGHVLSQIKKCIKTRWRVVQKSDEDYVFLLKYF